MNLSQKILTMGEQEQAPNLDSYDAEIRDEMGDVVSATVGKPNVASVIRWYKEHGVDFKDVKWNDEAKMFTYGGKSTPVSFKHGQKY